MTKIKRRVYTHFHIQLEHDSRVNVHLAPDNPSDCIENNPPLSDSLSIVACRQLYDAIAQNDPTVCIEVLEQEGIPKDWAIMLLPLIQVDMGGEQ